VRSEFVEVPSIVDAVRRIFMLHLLESFDVIAVFDNFDVRVISLFHLVIDNFTIFVDKSRWKRSSLGVLLKPRNIAMPAIHIRVGGCFQRDVIPLSAILKTSSTED